MQTRCNPAQYNREEPLFDQKKGQGDLSVLIKGLQIM